MVEKSNDSLINRLRIFSRGLPSTHVVFFMLLLLSIITGLISTTIIDYRTLTPDLTPVVASGLLAGIFTIFLPTLLTVIVIKYLKRYVRMKHLLFLSGIGAFAYSLFIVIASFAYIITNNYSLSTVIVLLGDASIFGWWFFLSKIVLAQKKKAAIFALIQPTFNVLLYTSSSRFIFTFSSIPLKLLLLKLYAGIFIFFIISYVILYVLENPVKKGLGYDSVDIFSNFVQNWLFDIDMGLSTSSGGKQIGVKADVDAQTVVFKKRGGGLKAILFAPWIHYGPMGTLGGSNFPYLLERYSVGKYKVPTFIMHCAVDEGSNPISSSQLNVVKRALDDGVSKGRKITGAHNSISSSMVIYGESALRSLMINDLRLVTFTRAPKVTEDISPEASRLFRELFKERGGETLLIDAHNSRYENAPEADLRGVTLNSKAMNDYISAIEKVQIPLHKSKRIRVGVGYVDAYEKLGGPADLAPGNLNTILFKFNGYKFVMVYVNANNMMPQLRSAILSHIKKKHGMDAEVYTSDTHFVNSLQRTASNVLGKYTNHNNLILLVDKAIQGAESNMEDVEVYYKRDSMKRFHIWGPNIRERAFPVINSVFGLARTLVPALVVVGFIIGAWIISYV